MIETKSVWIVENNEMKRSFYLTVDIFGSLTFTSDIHNTIRCSRKVDAEYLKKLVGKQFGLFKNINCIEHIFDLQLPKKDNG